MKPIKLILSAWGAYPNEECIDFSNYTDNGLFLITGATGSGKTTIFDGITYALYGNVSGKNREKTTLRSDFAKPETDTYVEFIFSHKGKEYKIKRSPKYNRPKKRGEGETTKPEFAELWEENKEPCTQVNEVNQRAEDIMGINYRQFKQIAMIAQGEFLELLLASSKERVEILRNIFQTEEFEKIQRKMSESARELGGKLSRQKSKMEEATSLICAKGEELNELLQGESLAFDKIISLLGDEIKEDKKEIKQLEKEIELFENQVKTITSKGELYFNIQKQREGLKEKLEQTKEKLEKEEQKREELEKKASKWESDWKEKEAEGKKEKEQLKQTKEEVENEIKQYEGIELEFAKQSNQLEKTKEEVEWVKGIKKRIKEEKTQEETLSCCQKDYEKQREKTNEVKRQYEEREEQYKSSAIGLIVKELKVGEPCPVCGSTEHPHIAQISEEVPDKEEVKKWKTKWEKEEKKKNDIFQTASNEKGKLDIMKKELEDLLEKKQLKREEIVVYEETVAKKETKQTKELKELNEKKERKQNLEQTKEELDKKWTKIEQKEEERKQEYETEKAKFQTMLEENKIAQEATKAVLKSSEKEEEKLKKEEKACLTHLKKEIKELADCEIESFSLKEKIDILEKEKKQLQKQKEEKQKIVAMNQSAFTSLKEKQKEQIKLEEEYGIVKDLEQITMGKNRDRLVFEHYVLSSYFEDIIQSANIRLSKMTAGRYELSKVEKVADARTTDSLNLEVFDAFTGKKRSVKTLSGGESFKTALALALGLSDIVKRYAGGIQIETLFIDEGFGSLDEESLNQALDTLTSLTDKNCLIGIISHVAELKERIENQIIIKKEKNGSYIHENTGIL